ncbi:MAG TPA: hypothetical protein VI039_13040 [Solirubrobacterales bacterium]
MSTGAELVPVDTKDAVTDVERQVAEARAQAEAIQVHDEASATVATGVLREIKARRKAAEEKRRELVDPLNKTLKMINADFKAAMAPFDEADRIVRSKVQDWTEEKERIRREEEERLELERQERERKVREERERQEAEARAKAEQAAKEQREAEEEARRAKDEADRETAEKLAEEARQKAQEAQTAESAIASLPDVKLPKAVVEAPANPAGITTPKRWVAEVTDITRLPDFLPNGTPLKAVITAALTRHMHDTLKETGKPPEMPGAKFKRVSGLAVRD